MSFLNTPDIQDDGQGNVNIRQSNGDDANLNVTGTTSGSWFAFNNMQNYGDMKIVFQNKDGKTPVDIVVSGAATIYKDLTVNSQSNLNGKTIINSQADNLPFQVAGAGGQFWFYSSGGQNNGAVIRGGTQANYGLVFTGDDRVRLEGVGGDNRLAALSDLGNIITSGGSPGSGYWYRFNNGLILQIRFIPSVGSPGSNMNVTYPIAFPNACVGASATLGNINPAYFVVGINPNSLSSLLVSFSQPLAGPNAACLSLIAIGF
jgi:hypothetical protein